MRVIHNARVHLLANLLNTLAGTAIAVGVAAPVAAAFFFPSGMGPSVYAIAIGAILWLTAAIILHSLAQLVVMVGLQ
jgi:hypothetical protein